MDPLAWGVLVLAIYPWLQVPVIVYLARRVELDGDDLPRSPTRALWLSGDPTGSRSAPGAACTRCGVENDPVFAYCSNCLAPLG